MAQDPTEWFDQFPPPPDGWEHNQWCWRHWAPAPIFGADGITMLVKLQQIFLDEIATPDIIAAGPAALNAHLHNVGRLCCTLGDQRVYDLWGQCPPRTVCDDPECPVCKRRREELHGEATPPTAEG